MGVEIHLKPIAVNLKLSSVVRSDQKRKSKEKMKMFYINLCLVMVAYTAAKEETGISSGANRVQDKENLVPVERLVLRVTERSVKARGHEQALGPAQRVITKGYHRVPAWGQRPENQKRRTTTTTTTTTTRTTTTTTKQKRKP